MTTKEKNRFFEIKGDAEVASVTMVKEGASGGDGAGGVSICFKTTTSAQNICLILHGESETGADKVNNFFWGEDGYLRFYGVGRVTSSRVMEFCKFKAFKMPKQECRVNKISFSPTNNKDAFEISLNCYVRDPSAELLAASLSALKTSQTIHVEQFQLDAIDSPSESDPDEE